MQKNKSTPGSREYRNGQAVSPDALAAFYRKRSESLQNSHTTTREQEAKMIPAPTAQPSGRPEDMGWIDYIISALRGTPGKK